VPSRALEKDRELRYQHASDMRADLQRRKPFPLGNPIGRHYRLGDNKPENDVTVIGVAKDVKFDDLAEELVNLDYFPYTQHPWGLSDFEVRYTGGFAPVAAAVQQTIHSIDRNLVP